MNLINQWNPSKNRYYIIDKFSTKLFFILVLYFFNSMCFAGPKEEEERLNYINTSLVRAFDPLQKSPSRLAHEMIIKAEEDTRTQFTLIKVHKMIVDSFYNRIDKQFKDEGFFKKHLDPSSTSNTSNIFSYLGAYTNAKDEASRKKIAKDFLLDPLIDAMIKPKENFLYCNYYALYTYFSIIFDIMNQQANMSKSQLPLFTSVALVIATPRDGIDPRKAPANTGDHIAVLVEGSSTTSFLIDPWINKVVVLPRNFTLISKGYEDIKKRKDLNILSAASITNSNQSITPIYQVNGFYDMQYVSPQTEWLLFIVFSQNLRQLITEDNVDMMQLYAGLEFILGWKNSYISLFPTKSSETKLDK